MPKNYLENKIRELFISASNQISSYLYLEINNPDRELYSLEVIEEFTEMQLEYETTVRKLFKCIHCYLDMNGLNQYLQIFKSDIQSKISDSKELYAPHVDPFGEVLSGKLVNEILEFLSPFEFIAVDEIDLYLRRAGIVYLENILKSTAMIIENLSRVPSSESDIYKAIKHIINSMFPKAKNPKSNFIKTAKQYFPDVLIPELSAAVEYKYAKDEGTLKNVIDEISIDQKGYTGDNDYKIFYAVFYVTGNIWSENRFNEVWKEKQFPKNWKGFYVLGM